MYVIYVITHVKNRPSHYLLEPYTSGKVVAGYLVDRSGKQCRERFHNHLQQGIQVGDWTLEVRIFSAIFDLLELLLNVRYL